MIDIKLLERKDEARDSYLEQYKRSLLNRGASVDLLNQILELNKKRKDSISAAETAKAKQNKISGEIGLMKRNGQDASALLAEVDSLKQQVKALEAEATAADERVFALALELPNKTHSSVPVGSGAEENQLIHTKGSIPQFGFKPKEHFELGENLGVIDFERAGKTTGARFTFLKGAASQMERALIQLMMDLHSGDHGYTEMIPPFIVNSTSLQGTGQFPKFKEDVFHLSGSDYYLIPTAEVPVTNYYGGEILDEALLPQRFVAYSPCFRSEAGSAGRDTRGLIRQHQFDKVELMIFCRPEDSYEWHEKLTSDAEKVLEALELPYRRMLLCTGDMGFGSAKTYDLEVWLPGQNAYREISSCSNFEDFQARRANIRFKSGTNKPQFVHTLNGSGLAVGRTLVAIFENYQQEDGSIAIPKALQPYMRNATKIDKK